MRCHDSCPPVIFDSARFRKRFFNGEDCDAGAWAIGKVVLNVGIFRHLFGMTVRANPFDDRVLISLRPLSG
jgi:hypothetical protein